MHEIHITNSVEKKQCLRLIDAIEHYGGKMLDFEGRDQVKYHMDQLYIDFRIGDHIVTLHWEHYTGIYLLSDTATEQQLSLIWEGVKPFIK
ncbi:MAG: hypothetical protein EAY65_03030 [Alphaproteobacteria bacterium]|nr:MAG: hypothetical protein EAY65_03030 [Alphaproteobacteria bacterium]